MVLLTAQLKQPLQGRQAAQELKRRLCEKGAGEKGGLITVKLSKEELSQIDRVLKDFCLGTLG